MTVKLIKTEQCQLVQGDVWRHHKGELYRIVDFAVDANNSLPHDKVQVVYVRTNADKTFIRSVDEFTEKFVKHEP